MTLLLVDGSNFIMRAAFGGDVAPDRAAPIACGLIERAARIAGATHMVVALDSPEGSWRSEVFPAYKAHRTTDTTPWLVAAFEAFTRKGWYVEATTGYEADDIIATIATRTIGGASVPASRLVSSLTPPTTNRRVVIASSDSDLCCLASDNVSILKPMNGGEFKTVIAADVCAKYQIATPAMLTELKALMGESGDNIPGVPGIGPVRGAKLLQTYSSLNGILLAGVEKKCKHSMLVHQHEAVVTLAQKLVSLSCDAPIAPIQPKDCAL